MRAILPELAETPEISWNRLAAEMKANIRLGLAAGECVRTGQAPLRETPLFTRARAVVAFASVVVLLVAGLVLQHPAPERAEIRWRGGADHRQWNSGAGRAARRSACCTPAPKTCSTRWARKAP